MRHFARDLYLEANPTAVIVPKFTFIEIGLAGNALTKEKKHRWHVEIDEFKSGASPQDDDLDLKLPQPADIVVFEPQEIRMYEIIY